MLTPKLANCPNCRKLFLKVREICDECLNKQEEDFLKVSAFLREHPGSSIQELSEATGVSTVQIRKFILTGRIMAGNFPNLTYGCETCGEPISSGKICNKCLKSLKSVQDLKGPFESAADHKNSDKNKKANGYISKYL